MADASNTGVDWSRHEPVVLEASQGPFTPIIDRRARVPEPLPVRLMAISDVRLVAPAGAEREMDALYVDILGFERIPPLTSLIYRADNVTLSFELQERPVVHESLRATVVEVPSLGQTEHKLIDAEIPYTRQRSTAPGVESLVLLDPAGNWLELVESRLIG
jgi:hypothetical protein